MNYRIARYSLQELVVRPEEVAASLNAACQRDHRRYRVSGLCQTAEEVVFALELDPTQRVWTYVLAPCPRDSAVELAAEIASRWQGGFATRGLVRLADAALGLFERAPA